MQRAVDESAPVMDELPALEALETLLTFAKQMEVVKYAAVHMDGVRGRLGAKRVQQSLEGMNSDDAGAVMLKRVADTRIAIEDSVIGMVKKMFSNSHTLAKQMEKKSEGFFGGLFKGNWPTEEELDEAAPIKIRHLGKELLDNHINDFFDVEDCMIALFKKNSSLIKATTAKVEDENYDHETAISELCKNLGAAVKDMFKDRPGYVFKFKDLPALKGYSVLDDIETPASGEEGVPKTLEGFKAEKKRVEDFVKAHKKWLDGFIRFLQYYEDDSLKIIEDYEKKFALQTNLTKTFLIAAIRYNATIINLRVRLNKEILETLEDYAGGLNKLMKK